MTLTFYGGAGMVTGANYLFEHEGVKILVDCGLHQGSNFCERHNWDPFPYRPADISAVFITHAHIDHTGRLPTLVRDGFRGRVYSTPPTRDAAALLLTDSEHLLAEEAERIKQLPLYTIADVDRLMHLWKSIEYHAPVTIGPFRVTLFNAGHILGSSSISLEAGGKTVVVSGDLGNSPAPIIGSWEPVTSKPTYALIESTYGDRIHEASNERKGILESVIEDTVHRKGTLLIPAFAMERTQELLFELNQLVEEKRIPHIPVYLDSPLAIKLTDVYRTYERFFDSPSREHAHRDDLFTFKGLHQTLTTEESKSINEVPPPKVIIAGSGMSHGGRIVHHERRYLSDQRSTLLIVGYQAVGSLGRRILDGAPSVRMFGEEIPIRCHVKAIGGYSAHADQPQLIKWLEPLRSSLKTLYVVQGEGAASEALAHKVTRELGITAVVPTEGQSVVLY